MKTIALILLSLVFAGSAYAVPSPEEIASYYAGKPMKVSRGANGLFGYTYNVPWAELELRDRVWLHEGLYDALTDPNIFKPGRTRDMGAGRDDDAQFWDAAAVHVLLHEVNHHRFPNAPEGAVDCAAHLMLPSALERWYGIEVGSVLSMRLWRFQTYDFDCGWFNR